MYIRYSLIKLSYNYHWKGDIKFIQFNYQGVFQQAYNIFKGLQNKKNIFFFKL